MQSKISKQTLTSVAAASFLVFSSVLRAQDESAPRASGDGEANIAADSLEEIFVTARRREERLRDVPVAVTALTGDELERQNISTVTDALGAVPNLYVSRTGFTSSEHTITLRGVGVRSPLEPSVAVFLDGVYMPSNVWNMSFLELERIEVLRGPQGVLFGRNTEGGAINIISKAPSATWAGRISVEAGEFNTVKGTGYLTGPLSDSLAFSLAALSSDTDGYIRNVRTGTDQFPQHINAARLSGKWTPAGSLSATLHLDYMESEGGLESEISRTPNPGNAANVAGRWEVARDFVPTEKTQNGGASLQVDLDLAAVTLSSISGYRYEHTRSCVQADFVAPDLGAGLTPNVCPAGFPPIRGFSGAAFHEYRQSIVSQELRLSSGTAERWTWQAGVYGYTEDNDLARNNPFGNVPISPGPGNIVIANAVQTRDGYALFGQATYKFLDSLEGSLGIRYQNDEVKQAPFLFFDFPFAPFPLANVFTTPRSENYSGVSPQGSLTYHFNRDAMIYTTVARGIKSGGFPKNPPAFEDANIPFADEIATNYEIGSKVSAFDRRLTVDFAAFWIELEDLQVTKTITFPGGVTTPAVVNAGAARSRGFELEVTALPLDGLMISGSVAHSEAEFLDYQITPTINRGGSRIEFVPEWTGRFATEYRRPVTGAVNASFRTEYSYVGSILNGDGAGNPLVKVAPQSWIDVALGLHGDSWDLSVYADNIFDRYNVYSRSRTTPGAFTFPAIVPSQESAGPPRRIGIRATKRF